jgi:hypothetical protein
MLTTASVIAALTNNGVASVDAGGVLEAGLRLRLPFFEAVAVVTAADDDHVDFDGALPAGAGRARLRRQGALSIGQLREQKLGIKAVDDAFIVHVDDDGFALLTRCRDELLALVPSGAPSSSVSIVVDDVALRVCWPGDAVAELPALWEKLVSLRAGA